MQLLRPPGSKIKRILGNRLRVKRTNMKLLGRIVAVTFGSSLDDEPIFEAQIIQVGNKFEYNDCLAVGDKVFIHRHAGIILLDGTILISALDIVAARNNGKVEKLKAPVEIEPEIVDYDEATKRVIEEEPCTN